MRLFVQIPCVRSNGSFSCIFIGLLSESIFHVSIYAYSRLDFDIFFNRMILKDQKTCKENLFTCEISQFRSFLGELTTFVGVDAIFSIHISPCPESGSGKHFHTCRMRSIDFPPRKTLRKFVSLRNFEILIIFASIHISPFPESGLGKHFHASGIRAINSRIKLPL
jgi:hypothetical protein